MRHISLTRPMKVLFPRRKQDGSESFYCFLYFCFVLYFVFLFLLFFVCFVFLAAYRFVKDFSCLQICQRLEISVISVGNLYWETKLLLVWRIGIQDKIWTFNFSIFKSCCIKRRLESSNGACSHDVSVWTEEECITKWMPIL